MGGGGSRWVFVVVLVAVLASVAPTSAGALPDPTGDDELVYVALGDSFTSGPLVLPHDTSFVPQDCGQSIFNYPHLAAGIIDANRFVDMSCGSAEIEDLYEPQDGLPLGGTNRPQLDAVGPDTDVVTLGISGNDLGYVGLATDCMRLLPPPARPPCTAGLADGPDPFAARLARVAPELGEALDDIHAKAPRAEVFVVGYPAALPDDGRACWPYVPFLAVDLPYLVAKYKEMNAMLAEQAALHDATYVDIYTPSLGHDVCQLPGVAWVNAIVVVPPSYPAHPNQLGLTHAGRIVGNAIRDRLEEAKLRG